MTELVQQPLPSNENDETTAADCKKLDETIVEEEEGNDKKSESEDQTRTTTTTDEEGLLKEYDVIIYGTGLIASILASALARAGKTVLQCDGNDYYGELDAVWTYPYIMEQWGSTSTTPSIRSDSDDNYDNKKIETDDDTDTMNIPLCSHGSFQNLVVHSLQTTVAAASTSQQQQQQLSPPHVITVGTSVVTPYGAGTVELDWTATTTTTTTSLVISLHNSGAKLYVGRPSNDQLNECSSKYDNNSTNHSEQTAASIYLDRICHITAAATVEARHILFERSRQFALDVTPTLLFTVGSAVPALLTSQVADYLEFKPLEGLFLYNNESKSNNNQLQKVPCSKNHVFASPLLGPMEKRRLMKFLQLAHDYAAAKQDEDNDNDDDETDDHHQQQTDTTAASASTKAETTVQSLNERHLNQGRSLARPQNKAVLTDELNELEQCMSIQPPMSFQEYLAVKQKLSPKLIQLVRYALALDWKVGDFSDSNSTSSSSTTTTVRQGLEAIGKHMQSLGRFGGTAFLVPLYGSGELPQAFCRSAAVYGATQLLRRPALGILVEKRKENNSNAKQQEMTEAVGKGDEETDDPQQSDVDGGQEQQQRQPQIHVKCVLMSLPTDDDHNSVGINKQEQPPAAAASKQIRCSHVVVPEEAMMLKRKTNASAAGSFRVVRRISILRGKPIQQQPENQKNHDAQQQQQRHVVIFPPNSIQISSSDPKQQTPHNTIHGLLVDESVNVAPHPTQSRSTALTGGTGACTVLHLTTVVAADNRRGFNVQVSEALFQEAVKIIAGDRAEEIFHMTFSYPTSSSSSSSGTSIVSEHLENKDDEDDGEIRGLHILRRGQPGIACDDAFDQAKRIFHNICRGDTTTTPFLAVAEKVTQEIEERLGEGAGSGSNNNKDDGDGDNYVLESALGMITQEQQQQQESNQLDAETKTTQEQ